MIDPSDYIKQEGVYLKAGKLWRIIGYCESPSITMEEIGSIMEHRESFGILGVLNETFTKIKGLKYNHYTNSVEANELP